MQKVSNKFDMNQTKGCNRFYSSELKADLEASGKVVLKSIVDGTKKIEEAVKETVKKV